MDQKSYKEGLATLRRVGFTAAEIKQLCQLRRTYLEKRQEQDQASVNLSHLQFIRWLVKHGRMRS